LTHITDPMRQTLLLATGNAGKIAEVRRMLDDLPVELKGLGDFPGIAAIDEDGASFAENAGKKALYYAQQTGLWTLADDSGLEVDALNGEPGIFSARFAGAHGDDAANNAKLVRALAGVSREKRTARFRCALALADPEAVRAMAEGAVEGLIIDDPRGHNGFGYDPHFFVPALGKTAAELAPAEKNRVSHRGQALAAMRPKIVSLMGLAGA